MMMMAMIMLIVIVIDSTCLSPVAFYLHVLILNDSMMNIPSSLFHFLSPSFFVWLPPQVTFIQYLSLFCTSCAFAVLWFTLSVLCFLHPSISMWLLKALFNQASVSMTTTWRNSCLKIWEVFLPPHNEALVSLWLWWIHLLCNTLDARCSISIVGIQNKWTEHLITWQAFFLAHTFSIRLWYGAVTCITACHS